MIVGSPGSGKSTMSKKLSEMLGIEVVHLDKLFWNPGWVESEKADFDRRLSEALEKDSWIADGNYSRTIPLRLERADTVILLNFPRIVCVFRALKRSAFGYGRVRSDMGEGCPERFDFEFLKYVWNFRKRNFQKVKSLVEQAEVENYIEIKSNADLKRFYDDIKTGKYR